MKDKLLNRFIRYVKVETRSYDTATTIPSSEGQLELGKQLAQELTELGMSQIRIEKSGNVVATLASNIDYAVPTIGFIAHMDTADFNAKDIQPQIVENYDGQDIVLNEEEKIVLSVETFPALKKLVGHTLVTTNGLTLLGADDKAGIAAIMSAVEYLIAHPEIKHGDVRVCFSIDEEIGLGAHSFDVEAFNADFAYTVDGGPLGGLDFETFNGAACEVKIKGVSVHPGSAKDKMIDAVTIARRFADAFPAQEVPEHTEGYEGYYWLNSFDGNVEDVVLQYIIRDHDTEKFNARKAKFAEVAATLNQDYPYDAIQVKVTDQYYNMRNIIEERMEIVDLARQAMTNLNIESVTEAVRGGTDGSQLSFKGLPTPNLFTGGDNFHGKYEYVSVDDMLKASQVIIEIIRLNGEKA